MARRMEICCAIHSAVGCSVILIQISSKLPPGWPGNHQDVRRMNPIVGTADKSIAAMCGAWLRRKVPSSGRMVGSIDHKDRHW